MNCPDKSIDSPIRLLTLHGEEKSVKNRTELGVYIRENVTPNLGAFDVVGVGHGLIDRSEFHHSGSSPTNAINNAMYHIHTAVALVGSGGGPDTLVREPAAVGRAIQQILDMKEWQEKLRTSRDDSITVDTVREYIARGLAGENVAKTRKHGELDSKGCILWSAQQLSDLALRKCINAGTWETMREWFSFPKEIQHASNPISLDYEVLDVTAIGEGVFHCRDVRKNSDRSEKQKIYFAPLQYS